MIVRRISMRGFMSYREEQTLLFDAAPLWVLAGANGSGKSSVFDVITFVLYGCHRGGSRPSKELINHDSDALVAELDFELDATVYRLRRTLSRSGKSTWSVSIIDGEKTLPVPDADSKAGFEKWVKEHVRLSYKSFISSVLLLQGQSERLLNSEPKERYELLSELIDLDIYQRLHHLADEQRKRLDEQSRTYAAQLQSFDINLATEVERAREQVAVCSQELESAKADLDSRLSLLAAAEERERLLAEQAGLKERLAECRLLTARAEEILSGALRHAALETLVPALKSLQKNLRELQRLQEEVVARRLSAEQHARTRDKALERRRLLEERLESLRLELDALDKRERSLSTALSEATSLARRLEERQRLLETVARLEAKLEAQQARAAELSKAREELSRAEESERALAWIRSLLRLKSELEELKTELSEIDAQVSLASESVISTRKLERQCARELSETDRALVQAAETVATARERKAQLDEHLTLLNLVSQTGLCHACGQKVTPEHIRLESEKCADAIAKQQKVLADALRLQDDLMERQRWLKSELAGTQASLEVLLLDLERLEQTRLRLASQISQLDSRLSDLKSNPPLQTVDINAELINALEQAAAAIPDLRATLSDYTQLHADIIRTQTALEQSQELLRASTPAPTPDLNLLNTEYQRLITRLEQQKEELRGVEQELEGVRGEWERLEGVVKGMEISLAVCRERLGGVREVLEAELKAVPQEWRREVSDEELTKLEEELAEKGQYRRLEVELKRAEGVESELSGQLARLEMKLREISEEARRPSLELRGEVTALKLRINELDQSLAEARSRAMALEVEYRHRQELETKKLKTDYQLHLHKILTSALGREGLQLKLLRDAEQSIVAFADETLDGLSRGRLRLELRSDDQSKALDLLVRDMETGAQPMPVALVSGSQRFRIAVSLALAIGRYVGGRPSGAQTVIIDEGFGSLDKNGRDDIIEQLQQLQERLARIILVSHQEEFTSAFNNGYTVTIQGGSSRVRFWSRS